MGKNITTVLLSITLLCVGCEVAQQQIVTSKAKEVSVVSSNISSSKNVISNTSNNAKSLEDVEKTVLEEAQKNYQDSYNEYVRCLRESGPQTIETLQALTVYQKNYQIYQMLLKAEEEKK